MTKTFSPGSDPEIALSDATVARKPGAQGHNTVPALMLGAVGVVYGDIGTSPLYAFKEAVKAAIAGGARSQSLRSGAYR